MIGVWHGVLEQGKNGVFLGPRFRVGETHRVELTVDRLIPNDISGQSIYHSPQTIVRCRTMNRLTATDGNSYRFEAKIDHCAGRREQGDRFELPFTVTAIPGDRVEVAYFSDTSLRGPTLTVVLDRKFP